MFRRYWKLEEQLPIFLLVLFLCSHHLFHPHPQLIRFSFPFTFLLHRYVGHNCQTCKFSCGEVGLACGVPHVMTIAFLSVMHLYFNWVAQYLIYGHTHGLTRGILNTHGLPSNGWSPMNTIILPERLWATNKSLCFNIEWNSYNYASPFVIPTNTRKLSASTACVFNVARLVESPPTYTCHFSFF